MEPWRTVILVPGSDVVAEVSWRGYLSVYQEFNLPVISADLADLFISPHNSPLISDDSESLILWDQKLQRGCLILGNPSYYRRLISRKDSIVFMIAGVIRGTRVFILAAAFSNRGYA